jgi:hypothetical protein
MRVRTKGGMLLTHQHEDRNAHIGCLITARAERGRLNFLSGYGSRCAHRVFYEGEG